MLNRQTIVWSVAAAGVAAYVKWGGIQLIKDVQHIEAGIAAAAGGRATEPVLIYFGRLVVFIIAVAYTFIFGQSIVAAIRRYRYKPTVLPPLQPLSEDERQAHQASASNSPADHHQPQDQAKQQQQQQQTASLGHDERRKRALEAMQRDLDQKAAELKEQQRKEEEARAARAAAAAAEQAAKAAAEAAEQARLDQAAFAARTAQLELWRQQTREQQRARSQPAVQGSTTVPHDAEHQVQQQVQQDRVIREEQDAEYQASLQADAAKQSARQQTAQLKAFRAALQEQLPPEAAAGSDGVLAIRVRLPDGSTAVRQFASPQSFADVLDWVYTLSGMPLLVPGTWALASSFPKRQLQAADGLWAPGNYIVGQDLQAYCAAGSSLGTSHSARQYELAAPDSFTLTISPLAGAKVTVQVSERSSVLEVKQKVEQELGVQPDRQRLIFSGQVLKDDQTLKDYKITSQHVVQLAIRMDAYSSKDSSSDGIASAADSGSAAGDRRDTEDVLVVSDVAHLKEEVAHGASQLALYVVECVL